MSDATLLDTLRPLSFLRDIAEEDLAQLAPMARCESYAPDTVLFREGSALNRFFLVAEGKAALEIGGEGEVPQRFLTVGPGELLGWTPLFSQPFTTATARTLTSTQVVSINAAQVLELCRDNPRVGFLIMQRAGEALAVRLNAIRLLLLDVLRDDLPPESDEPGAGD